MAPAFAPPMHDARYTAETHPDIQPLPAFADNYIWLWMDASRHRALVVDPGDAAPVLEALGRLDLSLAAVLITHHHPDHVGGLHALRAAWPDVRVHGPANSPAAGIDHRHTDGTVLSLPGFSEHLSVIAVPGHTLDHVAYFAPGIGTDPRPALFCGDSLFAGGCGRLFEGSPAQMAASLDRLAALPDTTLVYCAHEYTASNLRFALAVEPDNPTLRDRMAETIGRRDRGQSTVPSTLGAERASNPFLRTRVAEVVQAVTTPGEHHPDSATVFARLRTWKDRFR